MQAPHEAKNGHMRPQRVTFSWTRMPATQGVLLVLLLASVAMHGVHLASLQQCQDSPRAQAGAAMVQARPRDGAPLVDIPSSSREGPLRAPVETQPLNVSAATNGTAAHTIASVRLSRVTDPDQPQDWYDRFIVRNETPRTDAERFYVDRPALSKGSSV